jgi:hypothetical protein
MSRKFTPSVLTANDLLEGDVIYLAPSGAWVRNVKEARLFTDAREAAEALDMAEGQQDRLVGAYLAPAQPGPDGPAPGHFREAFRAQGPSNYAHGKHAEA